MWGKSYKVIALENELDIQRRMLDPKLFLDKIFRTKKMDPEFLLDKLNMTTKINQYA